MGAYRLTEGFGHSVTAVEDYPVADPSIENPIPVPTTILESLAVLCKAVPVSEELYAPLGLSNSEINVT